MKMKKYNVEINFTNSTTKNFVCVNFYYYENFAYFINKNGETSIIPYRNVFNIFVKNYE